MGCGPSRVEERGARVLPPDSRAPQLKELNFTATPATPNNIGADQLTSSEKSTPAPSDASGEVAAPPGPASSADAGRALVRALKQGDTAKVAELIDSDRSLLERRALSPADCMRAARV